MTDQLRRQRGLKRLPILQALHAQVVDEPT
jgi:hypothetical protein